MKIEITESLRRLTPYRLRRLVRSFLNRGNQLPQDDDAEIQLRQLQDILRREHGFVPAPPKKLQTRVLGLFSPDFVESGWHTFQTLEHAFAKTGQTIRSFETVLDFGCGCGRVIRAFHNMLPQARLFGTDIDPEAIEWLSRNYRQFAQFSVNGALPPLPFENETFDLIYGISVFTHLPETMQFSWLAELQRIARPGGMLLMSTHGERQAAGLNASNRRRLQEQGFSYIEEEVPTTEGLPAFYQTAFHSHDYIRNVWTKYFEVVRIEPQIMDGISDLVILRKR